MRKRQTRFTGFDQKILGMYARGMTVRDIQGHLEDVYGVEVSPDLISRVLNVNYIHPRIAAPEMLPTGSRCLI